MKIYVGCSLTQAPEQFKKDVAELKTKLRTKYEVMEFLGLTAGTAEDVYKWDIHECVAKCDVFVALCDFPALGVGYELGVAVEKLKKLTLVLAQTDSKVSRLIQGVSQPHYKFLRYQTMDEIPEMVEEFVIGRFSLPIN